MCSNAENAFALAASVGKEPNGSLPSLEQYRLQLYNYAMAERIRLSQLPYAPLPPYGYAPRLALSMSLYQRALAPEEPKPQHSYIGLIAMAILSVPDCKLVLSDIYQHILDNYPYFRSRGPGWRNSIRHNLSLNDCFVKAGRSANGKGHYWAIHPANVDDFRKGDFRRRKAQRKVRKHMGLAVDDEGDDSPSPPPSSPPTLPALCAWAAAPPATVSYAPLTPPPRKRLFDVASLLAPDEKRRRHDTDEEDIDVVSGAGEEMESPAAPSARYPFMSGWSLPALEPGALLGRYYEHLAAAHYHRRSAPPPRASPHDEDDHAPSP